MGFYRCLLFCSFLSFEACVPFWKTSSPHTESRESKSLRVSRIELIKEDSDPRKAWIEDWITPPFSQLTPPPTWSCATDGLSLSLHVPLNSLSCQDLINYNSHFREMASCLPNQVLKVRLPFSCLKDPQKLAEFWHSIRMPPGYGILKGDMTHSLQASIANTSSPLKIEWTSHPQSNDWQSPPSRSWWSQSLLRGVVSANIFIPASLKSEAWISSLQNFLLKIKEPKGIKLYREILFHPDNEKNFPAQQTENSDTELPFIILRNSYTTPLFKDLCNYLDHWLKAQQILLHSPLETPPVIYLNCRISWLINRYPLLESEDTELPFFQLTRLPLPLYRPEEPANFPLQTPEDALSLSLIQNMFGPH